MNKEHISLKAYFARKIVQYVPLFFAVVTFNFILIHSAPGDPVFVLVGRQTTTKEYLNSIREAFGLNRPLYEQYFIYLAKILRGDLGYSLTLSEPVAAILVPKLELTLVLVGSALCLSTVLGIVLGVLASKRVYSITDNLISTIAIASYSVPSFWLAEEMLLVFALYLGLLPSGGIMSLGENPYGIFDFAVHAILPVLTLTLSTTGFGQIARLVRANMLEVLREDYIKTARAKGLPDSSVFYSHALRNSLIPIVTVLGVNVRGVIEGAVLIETVFGWPGLGKLTYDAALSFDYPVLMGVLILMSVVVIASQLVADLLYGIVDPRIISK